MTYLQFSNKLFDYLIQENIDLNLLDKKYHECSSDLERLQYRKMLRYIEVLESEEKIVNSLMYHVLNIDEDDINNEKIISINDETVNFKKNILERDDEVKKEQVMFIQSSEHITFKSFRFVTINKNYQTEFENKYITKELKKRFKVQKYDRKTNTNILIYYLRFRESEVERQEKRYETENKLDELLDDKKFFQNINISLN